MKDSSKAIVYLSLTILSWSLFPAIVKLTLNDLDNLLIVFYTIIFSLISLIIVNLFSGNLKALTKYSPSDFLRMSLFAFIGIILYHYFIFASIKLIPAGIAMIINYLWPIFIILFSIPILKERYNSRTFFAIFISFLGAVIIFAQDSPYNIINGQSEGYIFAALAAICYGIFSVLSKKFKYDNFDSMLIYYIFSLVISIPLMLQFSHFEVPNKLQTIISLILIGGLLNSIIFVFWFKALKYGDTHKMANAIYIVPFLSIIWTSLINSEPILISSLIGLFLIVSGALIQITNKF